MAPAENNYQSPYAMIPDTTSYMPKPQLLLGSDWSNLGASEHVVQFYETDKFLLDTVSDFIGTGLSTGEAVIVLATPAHQEALATRLPGSLPQLATAAASGQYVMLNAGEMLTKFMVNGMPDVGHFVDVIGGIVTRAAQSRPRTRIFGEMVALLWADTNYRAALHLEELWNQLQQRHRFLLCCAYPINSFDDEALAEPLSAVCLEHSHVIPTESYTALINPHARDQTIVLLQQKARLLEMEVEERKQAETALRAANKELEMHIAEREQLLLREHIARAEAERANRLKDEFLATVSHELRTPLTTIIGWAERLRRRKLDEATVARGLEAIERSAKLQAQIVEDILDVSRVITGKLSLEVEPVDVAVIITAAVDAVQLAAEAKNIHLQVTLDPFVPRLLGDATRLQQVVWNLLTNAVKFTPAGGRIDVQLECAGANVQISVRDTGEGISADFLPFIFERFSQADGSLTRRHGGLGLGLAIVRHLVELHGGTVSAYSPGKGQGATFVISLPIVDLEAPVD